MILTAATLFAKNICRPILWPAMSDQQVTRLAKISVLVITAAALCSAIYSSPTLVALLLMGYGGVGQFFPGVALGLYSKRVTMPGVFAGVVTGEIVFVALSLSNHDPAMGLNAGFIALCCNVAVVAVGSLLTPKRGGFDEQPHASVGVG
jgi:SSS family solute:Na+ symporter